MVVRTTAIPRIGMGSLLSPEALHLTDFLHSVWISFLFLALRLISERLLNPLLSRLLAQLKPGAEKLSRRVYDDFFIATLSGSLEVLALYVVATHNYGCRPWDTDPCLLGWPHHAYNATQRWYFIATVGYNLYEFLCTCIGCGTILKTEMMVHHALTVLLVVLAYSTNLIRYGTMWMALFDLSNPLLHGAKILNAIDAEDLKPAKWSVYFCFATVFFIARVVATPYSILRPAIFQSFGILPFSYSLTFITLMGLVYGLQCFWFYKIVLIGIAGGRKSRK